MLFRSNEARTLFLISGKKLCRQTEPCLGTLLLALGAWTKWAIVFAIKAAWIHRQFGGGGKISSLVFPSSIPSTSTSFFLPFCLSLSLFLSSTLVCHAPSAGFTTSACRLRQQRPTSFPVWSVPDANIVAGWPQSEHSRGISSIPSLHIRSVLWARRIQSGSFGSSQVAAS